MPTYFYVLLCLAPGFFSCDNDMKTIKAIENGKADAEPAKNIRGISLPKGFKIVENGDSSYANWLLDISLRKDKTVYLFNGDLKGNQAVQFGVLDINIGKKDLIQCADAAIKLRADFLLDQKRYQEIKFTATSGDKISFSEWLQGIRWKERSGKLAPFKVYRNNRNIQDEYNSFMDFVFAYCGTYSLSKELKAVTGDISVQPGDVFIEGGFPGHAVTVMAVAQNTEGENIFLLSQGYMPAQDIHIIKNYVDPELSPWYSFEDIYPLYTPEWQFGSGSLRRWQ